MKFMQASARLVRAYILGMIGSSFGIYIATLNGRDTELSLHFFA